VGGFAALSGAHTLLQATFLELFAAATRAGVFASGLGVGIEELWVQGGKVLAPGTAAKLIEERGKSWGRQ
jgi:hypothetical protein